MWSVCVCSHLCVDILCIHAWTCLHVFVFTNAMGRTRSIGIWMLQSTARCYSQGPGDFHYSVTEQLREGQWWRHGGGYFLCYPCCSGWTPVSSIGLQLSAVVNVALHSHQQQWLCLCIHFKNLQFKLATHVCLLDARSPQRCCAYNIQQAT